MNGISVVIPNYNGLALFPYTLSSLYAALANLPGLYEVIVVDDASTDGSVSWLQTNYSQIQVLVNEVNSGFSVTANRGVEAANYSHVLLLNSDVKLEPRYFAPLFKYFDQPDTFGVMGRIIGWDDEIIQDGAKYPSFEGTKIKTSENYLLCNEHEMQHGLYSMYLSGANAFFDREKFLATGGLNTIFSPFYIEDYELSLRAWRLGFKCYYDHNAVCRHKTSTTIKSKSSKRFIKTIYNRNKMFLHAIHLDGGKRVLWFFQLFLELVFQAITLKGFYIKAFFLFIKNYGLVKKARKQLQQLATRPLLSVWEVGHLIRQSIANKPYRRF